LIVRPFSDLRVWQKAHELTLDVYAVTRLFPNEERYGLTSQLRRAASSIPANIAEGCGRRGPRDFSRFLQIAAGSACELEYHLLLARDLSLLDAQTYQSLHDDVNGIKRMLNSYSQKLIANS
jgi:four helix bundle protein